MNPGSLDKAECIAKAVLYEGYMLYPYRRSSLKNRQRCTFGTLYPELHPDVLGGTEPCRHQTQCLVNGTPSSTVTARVRFLHPGSRRLEACIDGAENQFHPVEALAVGTGIPQAIYQTQDYQTQDEAVEHTVEAELQLGEIFDRPRTIAFEFPAGLEITELRDPVGKLAGRIQREQRAITGEIRFSVEPLDGVDGFRLTVELLNTTSYRPASAGNRSSALLLSLASAHTILGIRDGEFISLLDPPEDLREAAAACKNIGVYPVLVGEPGEHDLILASPIILYDYPQIAPESAGDFFDATEMDEMLTLRVMTLTEDEKTEMCNSDERMRELLARTEATAREQLTRTHGVVRGLHAIKDNAA